MHTLGSAASALYGALCLCRSIETGQCNPSKDYLLTLLAGMPESTYFRARKELAEKKWIRSSENGYELLVGDFDAIRRTLKNESRDSQKRESALKNESESLSKTRVETLKNESATLKNESPFIGRTNHEQTKGTNQASDARAHAREASPAPKHDAEPLGDADQLTPLEESLRQARRWPLAIGQPQRQELAHVANQLTLIAAEFGTAYQPTPERVARLPDFYRRERRRSGWGWAWVVKDWPQFCEWLKDQEVNPNEPPRSYHHETAAERQARAARDTERIIREAFASGSDDLGANPANPPESWSEPV